jgi:hypothetical protein
MSHSPALHVRVSRFDLEAVDAFARAERVRRSDAVRRLLRIGLAAAGTPTLATDPLAFLASGGPDDWTQAAAALEALNPERWRLEPVDDEPGSNPAARPGPSPLSS